MKSYKKKKEDLIFLKEINGLLISAKEIEKQYFISNNKNKNSEENNNTSNNLSENKKLLDRQMRGLKCILSDLQNNYEFKSPYCDELSDEKNSKLNENITQEITNNILELYSAKKFNMCYDLWKKYDFQKLQGVSPERCFDILKYLNILRDRYETRKNLINKFKNIKEINTSKSNIANNYISNINKYSDSNLKLNNISNLQNNSNMSMSDLYTMKLSENERMTQDLKRQIDNIKSNQN